MRLEFKVGVAYLSLVERLMSGLTDMRLFGKNVEIEVLEISRPLEEPLPNTQCFKADFLTPTRFAVPPLVRRRRALFDFFPRPLSLFKSTVRHGRLLGLLKLGTPFGFIPTWL
ncbi:MAG: hypothetical protein ACK4SY_10000 [Pyrobaculum sp.]